MSNQRITKKLNVNSAESFVRAIREDSAYYVFAAKHTPYTNGSDVNLPIPDDNVLSDIKVFDDMLFGKRIKTNDVNIMAKRYDWTLGTTYAMYDDTDSDLANKKFYALVNQGNKFSAYKCLFNNNDQPSTVEPTGFDTEAEISPTDGYIWKYMFSVDEFDMRRFATLSYFPIIPNQTIINTAVEGSIDIIKVEFAGAGYSNYTVGNFGLASNININNDSRYYGLNINASNIDGLYKNCLIRITDGAAENETRLITDYFIKDGKKTIVLDSPFTSVVVESDGYEIYPNVFVYDKSVSATSNCVARAIISPNGNTVSYVEVLNKGEGYRVASAKIQPDSTVNITVNNEASLRVIIPPHDGHGSNANEELIGRYVGVSTSFIGNSIPLVANNDYRTIGILKNPLFANVNIKLDSTKTIGSFVPNENIYRYKPVKLFGEVKLVSNNTVIGTNTDFINALRYDDSIIISDGSHNHLTKVTEILSDTSIEISTVPSFTSDAANIFLANGILFGKVIQYSTNSIDLTNVIATGYDLSSDMYGESSFSTAAVNTTSSAYSTINGRDADDFNAFNQLTKFTGSMISAAQFIEDESLIQEVSNTEFQPSASFHSIINNIGSNNDLLYVTNVENTFNVRSSTSNGVISGASSNAYFVIDYKYTGELISDSGEILYLENLTPIRRTVSQTETLKLILEL